jgi:hypothetical protein
MFGHRLGDVESICFKAGILRDMTSFRAGRPVVAMRQTLAGSFVFNASVSAGQADKRTTAKSLPRH